MAEAKVKNEDKTVDLVEVYIPKGSPKDDPNLFVGINGKNWLLPRGKKSMVPPEVKYEIERAHRAQDAFDEAVDNMIESAKQ